MRLEREEKENKKRLEEVWLLEINFLLLQPEAKEFRERGGEKKGKRNLKKGYKKFGY
ncbi:MAG: hypothetical protein RL656_1316 [Bacteroidota bacterium]